MLWELYSYGRVPYPRVVSSELTVYTSHFYQLLLPTVGSG